MARRFPQAVFTIGSDAATWNSNKEFDHYVAAAAAGVAETGRNVESGVRLFSKLGEHRYFGGDCHYKRNDVVVDAFVDNIGNVIKNMDACRNLARGCSKRRVARTKWGSCPLVRQILIVRESLPMMLMAWATAV
jgi:hypothetical protein